MAHNDGDPPPSKPLTLVGGYLGSGKTTLINRFLASPDAGRTAVVVNDFGDVNIDAALIRAAGADTLELTNGCICCRSPTTCRRRWWVWPRARTSTA